MKKIIIIALPMGILGLLFISCSDSDSSIPSHVSNDDYFPNKPGNMWVFEKNTASTTTEYTLSVGAETKTINGKSFSTLLQQITDGETSKSYLHKNKGEYWNAQPSYFSDELESNLILKDNVSLGETWTNQVLLSINGNTIKINFDFEVTGIYEYDLVGETTYADVIEVTYTPRIDYTEEYGLISDPILTNVSKYAKGIGPIYTAYEFGDLSVLPLNTVLDDFELILSEYSLAEE